MRKGFSTSFLHQNYIIFRKVISKLYHRCQDKFCLCGFAISFLYQKRRVLYQPYICFGERHIKAISFWKMKVADRRKIWNSYITVLYLDISLLQKALPQCHTLQDIGISRYSTRLMFLLMIVFTVEEYRRPVIFCPKRSSLLSPRRLRAKYTHRTNQRFVLCVFRPAGSKFTQA